MFCKYCGAPSETEVCPNCTAARAQTQAQPQAQPQAQYQPQYQAQPQAQYQPQYQAQPQYQYQPQYQAQPQYQPQPKPAKVKPPRKPKSTLSFPQRVDNIMHYLLAGVAFLLFTWFVLNVFCILHVNAKMIVYGSYKTKEFVNFGDATTAATGFGAVMLFVGNFIFGNACLVSAAIGVLYFLKKANNLPLYDRFVGKWLKFRPAFSVGALVSAGAITQILCYLLSGKEYGVSRIAFGVHWTAWIMLAIFAGVAVVDKVLLEPKVKQAEAAKAAAEEQKPAEEQVL